MNPFDSDASGLRTPLREHCKDPLNAQWWRESMASNQKKTTKTETPYRHSLSAPGLADARSHTLYGRARIQYPHLVILVALTGFIFGCQNSASSSSSGPADLPALTEAEIESAWESYELPPPSPELNSILTDAAAVYPFEECMPFDGTTMTVEDRYLKTAADGSKELCVWHHPAGCVPEGMEFAEVVSCDTVRTNGPSWFIPPQRRFESDSELFQDPEYRKELAWTRAQVAASGCACCHSSKVSGYASMFDIDAPGSWIDTLSMTGVVMGAGMTTEHTLLGYLEPAINFGFDRETTIFATTDVPRMQAFFRKEFERRGGSQADVETARATFLRINSSLVEEPTVCGTGEGLDAEGRLIWNGGPARQVYIQEVDAENPGSPPNHDKPANTVWALYSDTTADAMSSGTITPGDVPSIAKQAVPEAGGTAPIFENGRTYRLFVTPDFLRNTLANCTFTFGTSSEQVEPDSRTCETEGSLCVTLKIPENLSETPERMVVALFRQLPPVGPPDVFPPFVLNSPELTPGQTFDVLVEANTTGTYHVYAVLYMPGGGATSWQAVPGTDIVGTTDAFEIAGPGMTISEPIEMSVVQ
ncbi:MAG: hypothetical protein VYA30_07630 [Myxococcota bacterium]|nr:hypothetical protein [Myxococcota bacterium]